VAERRFSVGTDIGGTFTDMVVIDDRGILRQFKVPTTPLDRSRAVLEGFGLAAAEFGMPVEEFTKNVGYFAHGTTAATNAYIERKGERTILLTTRGFADTMFVQRAMGSWTGIGDRSSHYSERRNPVPLVPRKDVIEIDERLDSTGSQVTPLQHDQVLAAARRIRAEGVGAVAICFLWAFVRPDHEREAARIIAAECPGVFITISSDIAPIIGEYERTATTVVNSYLGPIIRRYVGLLEDRLRQNGFTGDFTVMDSAGGVVDAAEAGGRAVELMVSGPAGGVIASAALARSLGFANVITGDMGGTSFDAGLIVDGEPLVATQSVTGSYHIASPRIRITAIGAGGGSIASVDRDGVLTVGPESAGAVPGPAAYGAGGTRPTVTDADVVLGIIDPKFFLGGAIPLYRELAERAIREHVAEPLGLGVNEAAAGIRSVAENQMADLVRTVTIQQGYDPRDFVMFAYGGAGPTHAYAIAREAGIATVVVPHTATVHSGFGAVSSDRFRSFQRSDPQHTPPGTPEPAKHLDLARINGAFAQLEERCREAMHAHAQLSLKRTLYFRFRKQTHELAVPVPNGTLEPANIEGLVRDFFVRYERIYGQGTSLPDAGIEINTFRVEGRIPSPSAITAAKRAPATTLDAAMLGSRDVLFEREMVETKIYRGELVPAGVRIDGPAILEFFGTTVVIGPGQYGINDDAGNVVIRLDTGV
jgi:N-methylhydantoinase A